MTAAFPPLVPLSARVIGDVPPPVNASVTVAVSFVPAVAVGENLYVMGHDAPLTSVPPVNELQVVEEIPKSLAFAPVSVMLE